ncbi:MAG TPA: PhnD/SsuA/transferrin family substrate-binding protein [bacterium]|nr:PhnD/SsuA/transferrin family substrate-binding protein [bacterium]
MRKATIIICFALSTALLPLSGSVAEPQNITLRFAVNLKITEGGYSASRIEALMIHACEIFQEKSGYGCEVIITETEDQVIEMLVNGSANMAFIIQTTYAKALHQGANLVPIANVEFHGTQNDTICIYAIDEKFQPGNPESLRNSKIGLNSFFDWIFLQQYISDSGSSDKTRDYFDKVLKSHSDQSALMALVFKKFDAVVMDGLSFSMASKTDKRFKNIRKLDCIGEFPTRPVVFNSKLPADLIKRFTASLKKIHRDPDFKEFHFLFIATNARFNNINAAAYKPMCDTYLHALDTGWIRDYDKWEAEQK